MATYKDASFENLQLVLEGEEFIRCKFDKCVLTYSGGPLPMLNGCSFNESNFVLDGPAAKTINFLIGMYHGGMKDVVEGIFNTIRLRAPTEPLPGALDENGRYER